MQSVPFLVVNALLQQRLVVINDYAYVQMNNQDLIRVCLIDRGEDPDIEKIKRWQLSDRLLGEIGLGRRDSEVDVPTQSQFEETWVELMLTQCKLTWSTTGWKCFFLFNNQHYQMSLPFQSLHQATELLVSAELIRKGYSVQERAGECLWIESPNGFRRIIHDGECDCREFLWDLRSRKSCRHLCLYETVQTRRALFRHAGVLKTPLLL